MLEVFFPRRCLSCRAPARAMLCARCDAVFPTIDTACARCAMPAPSDVGRCGWCARWRPAFHSARAAAAYTGVARDALMSFKLGGERRAARDLALRMAARAPRDAQVMTFVPSTRRMLVARGFDPAEEIARALARHLRIPCRALLRKVRETPDQAGLSRARRRANLRGAFASVPAPPAVLLVDDVLTTGATADACASALSDSGAAKIAVLTFARAL